MPQVNLMKMKQNNDNVEAFMLFAVSKSIRRAVIDKKHCKII